MERIGRTLSLVKFSHSIFALPFALASLLVATDGRPSARLLLLVIAAMVAARTSAMAFNRWADAEIDKANPRTSGREIPAGLLSRRYTLVLSLGTGLAFLIICSLLNWLTLVLAPFVLLLSFGYSFAKRWTPLTHLWLGLAIGISPAGAWIAATGTLAWPPLILGIAVMLWIAGFDIIYAAQDHEIDLRSNLKSLVVSLGLARALGLSRLFHLGSVASFVAFGLIIGAGWIYYGGLLLITAVLAYEQSIVKPHDLSKVNQAFFTANGVVSFVFLISVMAGR